jgi:hypothetical protein
VFVLLLAVAITAGLIHFKPKPEEEEPETPSLSVVVSTFVSSNRSPAAFAIVAATRIEMKLH